MPRPAQHTPRSRDAALAKLTNVKRLLFAGTTALTGALTVVAANAFPGRTVKANASTADGTGPSTVNVRPGGAQQSEEPAPLQRPTQTPRPSSESGTPGSEETGSSSSPSGGEASSGSESGAPESSTGSGEATPSAPSGSGSPSGEPAAEAPASEAPATSAPETPVVSGGS
ncbi:MAG: hypothetical protein ACYDA6_09745 [Solirubrobacteraceae bacterium]